MKDEGRKEICYYETASEIPAFSQPDFWMWLAAYLIQGEKVIGWEGRRGGGAKVLLGRGSELREKEERRRQWQDGYESVCVAGGRARVLVIIVGFSGFGIQPQGNVEHRCPTANTRWVNWKAQGSVCWSGWPWWNVGQYYLISRHTFRYTKINCVLLLHFLTWRIYIPASFCHFWAILVQCNALQDKSRQTFTQVCTNLQLVIIGMCK